MRLKSLIDHAVIRHGKNITFVQTWNAEKKRLFREIYNPVKTRATKH